MPCISPHAVTMLAAHLPALRSLNLWCCSTAVSVNQLTLAPAKALTELRLHVCTHAADIVQRLRMPPRLQVLTAGLLTRDGTFLCAHTQGDVQCVTNAGKSSRLGVLILSTVLFLLL